MQQTLLYWAPMNKRIRTKSEIHHFHQIRMDCFRLFPLSCQIWQRLLERGQQPEHCRSSWHAGTRGSLVRWAVAVNTKGNPSQVSNSRTKVRSATNTKGVITAMRLGISTLRTWSSSSICFCDRLWKSANFTSFSFAANA